MIFNRSRFTFDQSNALFRSINQESNSDQILWKLQDYFLQHFDQSNRSLDWSKFLELEFSQRKFQNSNFRFIHFTNEYSPTLYHYYNISMYILIYTTYSVEAWTRKLKQWWDVWENTVPGLVNWLTRISMDSLSQNWLIPTHPHIGYPMFLSLEENGWLSHGKTRS